MDNKVSGFSSENMADRFSPLTRSRPMPRCCLDMSCNIGLDISASETIHLSSYNKKIANNPPIQEFPQWGGTGPP